MWMKIIKEGLKMTIYEFIDLHNECYETIYTLFDCDKQDVIFIALAKIFKEL